jgi:hypothetical protein
MNDKGRIASSGMLRRADLVRADVLEELSASFIMVTRIGEVGTTLAVTSNRRMLLSSGQKSVQDWGNITSQNICKYLLDYMASHNLKKL